MRPPDKTLCLQWVKEAWKSVTPEVVKKSFLACGITVNTDGSQDSEVSWLKQEGIATEASATIVEKTMGNELSRTAGDQRSFSSGPSELIYTSDFKSIP